MPSLAAPGRRRGSAAIRRRISRWLLVAAAFAALVGCRADIGVDIDMAHDGAGRVTVAVTFDEEVMRWEPDLGELLVFDDLVGWDITRQHQQTSLGERLKVVAVRRFADQSELAEVLFEIDQPPGGSAGLFRSVTVTAERDGAHVRYQLQVGIGLDRPVSELVNPATADALEGELFGMPIAEIEERAGAPLDELVTLVVQATVPQGAGRLPAEGVMTLNEGGMRELLVSGELFDAEVAAADEEAERLSQRASRGARIAIGWWILIGVIAVVVVVIALRGRRRRGLTFR
ncbi:hypothetical protein [Candidatus Poriferisodalis sp.]|uniref:hypothetical protein n=1 Tax=Candidatus Poriferisodalis sp. TaxID=3101277 RepID=UPI003B016E9D